MATGRRPTRSDSLPSAKAATAAAASATAVQSRVGVRPAPWRDDQIVRHEDEERVEGKRSGGNEAEPSQGSGLVTLPKLTSRMIKKLRRGLKHDELLGLGHPAPKVEADQPERKREQERDSPPARPPPVVAEQIREHTGDSHAHPDADRHRRGLPGTRLTASRAPRILEHEHGGGPELAAGRQPLCAAEEHEQDRRQQTDSGVARQKSDPSGRDGHQQDDGDQYRAAPTGVSQPTEDKCAERPHDQGGSIDGEGSGQCRCQILGGKEDEADDGRQRSVDGEVIPLSGIADARCRDGAPRCPQSVCRFPGLRHRHAPERNVPLRAFSGLQLRLGSAVRVQQITRAGWRIPPGAEPILRRVISSA